MDFSKYTKTAFNLEELNPDGSSNLAEQLRMDLRKDFTNQLRETMIDLVCDLNKNDHHLEEEVQEGHFKDYCVYFKELDSLIFAIDTSIFYKVHKT